ncbi:MAG: S-layer family protein [Cyanomargarita calcarea GSE-NOS-MK-12-04C]|jgi:large exoprotein involved in heme utilization and adhesion|uniref:S-layer family protein n=1 Tax=Cyanomargarita calcarea GSE-NOS-MK-12-04C TaxID=2839659 RepID=A0A951QN92_9CYAN|nr:S-layer family protein [Cyanomargarita calcarea GSE-NOS-MK-12-04C]
MFGFVLTAVLSDYQPAFCALQSSEIIAQTPNPSSLPPDRLEDVPVTPLPSDVLPQPSEEDRLLPPPQLPETRIDSSILSGGKGGNLNLQVHDTVLMRRDSQISSESGGKGNGGNITINALFIIGLENSDIIANAVQGNGGNIQITTEGIFGLDYRPQLTPNSDITASSEFGVNGTVDINNFGVDPSSGLVELPINLADSSQQIATGCSNNTGSSFVATGRGGIPQNPNQQVTSDGTWSDIRDISAYLKTGEVTAQIPSSRETLIQATSWHRNDQGKIELVTNKAATQVQQRLTCAGISR